MSRFKQNHRLLYVRIKPGEGIFVSLKSTPPGGAILRGGDTLFLTTLWGAQLVIDEAMKKSRSPWFHRFEVGEQLMSIRQHHFF